MPTPAILLSTWNDGLFRVSENAVRHEFAGTSVRSLTAADDGSVFAIVGAHALCRRTADGAWTEVAVSDRMLSCCVPVGDAVFVGTDDACILRVDPDGTQHALTGFDAVAGRETWYAGTALIDGKVVGPPLGIRSMTATCDDSALLANVHVGGIPRSTDAGATWQPTIDINRDVHQVCAHPTRPDLVIAAAAAGLCVSRDAGATWTVEARGLHAPHCSGVAFGQHDIFVSASADPFAPRGAVYRRAIDSDDPLQRIGGGLPQWTAGKADTGCIATRNAMVAIVDGSGCLYVSHDDGASWSHRHDRFAHPSGLSIT